MVALQGNQIVDVPIEAGVDSLKTLDMDLLKVGRGLLRLIWAGL